MLPRPQIVMPTLKERLQGLMASCPGVPCAAGVEGVQV